MTPSGYDHDREDFASLYDESMPYSRVCGAGDRVVSSIDPTTWLKIENQRGWPSCVGHGASTTLEMVYWFATGGEVTQFSRHFGWVESQRASGWRPSKNDGATIDGAVKMLKGKGLPEEHLAPYTYGDYYTDFDDDVYENAKQYKALHSYRMDSYEDCLDFIQGGVGAIIIGVPWSGGGWHCVSYVGFLDDGDLIMANSHGTRWEDGGFRRDDKRQVERYLNTRDTVFYGVSDMAVPRQRVFENEEQWFV